MSRQAAPAAPGQDPRRARLYRLGGLLVAGAAIAAVLLAVLMSGSTSELAPGKPVPGAPQTLSLLAGIPQQGATLGDPRAPATLVEFGDLQCPACAAFATGSLPGIVARYVRTGRVRLLFRPLDLTGHDSERAARMALAVGAQDRMWQFTELMYRNQGLENSGYVTDRYLRALAGAIPGVDVARALSQRGTPSVEAQLRQARELAGAAGVGSTPSFLLTTAGRRPQRLSAAELEAGSLGAALQRASAGPAG
jgi:protein-disulfide isomerase